MKKIITLVCLCMQTLFLSAQHVKTIDLSSNTGPNKYFVVLCGRNNTLTGHAFIVWGKEEQTGQSSSVDGAFGLYAKGAGSSSADGSAIIKSFFTVVPGEIANEFYKGSLSQDLIRLIIQVDKADYDKTFSIKDTWAKRNDYKLIENDCVTFVTEIAKALDIHIPVRGSTDKPWNYIDKFLDANAQSDYLFGTWVSNDPINRFKLEINKTNCNWTEKTQGGATLARTMDVKKEGDQYKIYRPNDNGVLQFLGYQDKLRAQILARGATPSFIILKRIDQPNLQGLWNGLVVTKDASANLKDIKQPGSTPAKQFDFKRQ